MSTSNGRGTGVCWKVGGSIPLLYPKTCFMCTQLTQNGRIIVPGNRAWIISPMKQTGYFKWGVQMNGHLVVNARIETLRTTWISKGYELMTIEVDSFLEKDHEFKFNKPRSIGIIYKEDHFLVITEPANKIISKAHHRQPCFERLPKLLAA